MDSNVDYRYPECPMCEAPLTTYHWQDPEKCVPHERWSFECGCVLEISEYCPGSAGKPGIEVACPKAHEVAVELRK